MEARKLRMSPAWVKAVKPGPVVVEYRDTEQRGLVLRVMPSGVKVWWARYTFKGEDCRFRIGEAPGTRLKKAREAAQKARASAEDGTDPHVIRVTARERAKVGETVAAALDSWLEDEKLGPSARWKGGLKGGTARAVLPHVNRLKAGPFAGTLVADLRPADVERFVGAPEAASTRNHALSTVRTFLEWARRKGLVERDLAASLVVDVKRERGEERNRVLKDAEIRTLIQGFDGTRYGPPLRMLFLTGLRRDEVLGMKWEWCDLDTGILTIPPEAEKAGRARGEQRRVALSPQAVDLLEAQRARLFAEGLRSSAFVFATSTGERPHGDALKPQLYVLRGRRQNGKPPTTHKLAKPRPALLPDDVTIHDIRRTVADALLNRLHVAPWIVDHVVLGHTRPKLLRTYMPNLPMDEAREGLTRWGGLLEEIVRGKAQTAEA